MRPQTAPHASARQRGLRVSAVMPVFNTAPYLAAALESLLIQTEPFHEIIAVNDGSTDGSLDILRKYEKEGSVRVVDQSNQGQGPARNVGAGHATGDWIYFFDSDDLASPHLVESVRRRCAAVEGTLDVVLFSGQPFLDEDVDARIVERIPSYGRPQLGHFRSLYEATRALESFAASYVSPCLYVVAAELLREKGLRFPSDYHEDDNFYLDLVAEAGGTVVLADVLFKRRIRKGSVMTAPKGIKHLRGYLNASARARRYSKHQANPETRQFFERKAIEYYLAAMVLSRSVAGTNPCKSLVARLRGIPSWKLTWPQYVAVLSGGPARAPAGDLPST
jgi:glycosyltransferase involved in cell wall biosynthesis